MTPPLKLSEAIPDNSSVRLAECSVDSALRLSGRQRAVETTIMMLMRRRLCVASQPPRREPAPRGEGAHRSHNHRRRAMLFYSFLSFSCL